VDTISQKQEIKNAVNELLSDETKMKVKLTLENPAKFHDKYVCRLLWNKFILTIQKKMVPCHFKNWLLRTTEMKVGYDACIPHDITFDPYFPELIFVGKGALIGGDSTLFTHKIEGSKLIIGKNILDERTMMAGLAEMMHGSKISKHSMLNLYSTLEGTIPEGELWGGKPAKLMTKFDAATIEKFFAYSKNDPDYYKNFKEKLKAFWKDPSQNYLKIYYDGNRLTAGDDWWRARSVFVIFWSGGLIEFCRLLPHSWFKTILLKLAGVKIGKNVYIGKGCIFDHLMTNTIILEDNVKLEDYVYIDGHEYTATQTVFGRVTVKKGAHLKHHAFVRTGTTIGENSVIESYSMAQREIPANEVWGGVPAKFVRKI